MAVIYYNVSCISLRKTIYDMMSNVKHKIVEPRQHKILGRLSNCYDCQTDHQTNWYTMVRSSDCDEIFIKINPLIQKAV